MTPMEIHSLHILLTEQDLNDLAKKHAPKDLPVEGVSGLELVLNLRTAREIGITIPPNVLAKADKVIK